MYYRKGRKRLQIDIPESIHKWLKTEASKHGITVTRFVLQIVMNHKFWSDSYNA